MQAHTGQPNSLEQYIDFSMITQAEGLKLGIEHYRRRKPHCSGTLVWQLNDCWPGISWSLVDYYRFPKAGYFYVRRAYASVSASFKPVVDGFELWVVNDTLEDFEDQLTWGQARFTGEGLHDETLHIRIPRNSARRVTRIHRETISDSPSDTFLYVHSGRRGFPSNRAFLTEIKDLRRLEPNFTCEKRPLSDHEMEVELSSDQFVYFVKLECPIDGTRYSDNYLDLFPKATVVVRVWNALGRAIRADDIAVSALRA
jgi:beta-mannosidase